MNITLRVGNAIYESRPHIHVFTDASPDLEGIERSSHPNLYVSIVLLLRSSDDIEPSM